MDSSEPLQQSTTEGDFTPLASADEYSVYFQQLQRVFRHLGDCYPEKEEKGQIEDAVTKQFVERLSWTMNLLRLKYLFRATDERTLWIDVTESGFPNHLEITELDVDLATRDEALRELPPLSILRRTLVDDLFRLREEPLEVLRQLSKRSYLEKLVPELMFRQFTEGRLVRIAEADGIRRYNYSFGCYDFLTNRPYLHFLTFNQDMSEPRLEMLGENFNQFLATLRNEGSRAPDVGVLAMSIDEALETIHPKALKRICLGPLYSKVLLRGRQPNSADSREECLKNLLLQFGRREDDFVLLLTEEVIFSKRQEISRGMFSPKGRVREVFAITESDPETNARRASAVNHYFLLPHELLQHVEPDIGTRITDFTRATKLTIDEMGQINGL